MTARDPLAEALGVPPAPAAQAAGADPMPGEPKTELGYARRLVREYGGRLRYVPEWRRWLVWDGRRWAHDATGQAQRWAKVIARRITTDALAIEDKTDRKAAFALASRGESSHAIAGRSPWPPPRRASWSPPATWTPTRSCSTAPTARSTCAPGSCGPTTRPTC